MNSPVLCALLLTLLHGNVFAEQTEESDHRVVNGMEAKIEDYPYIVHLRGPLLCGATVITYSHAFTAAHCVYNINPASITLYGGSTSKSRGGFEFNVRNVVVHPNYDPNIYNYDAAIVQVTTTFQGYNNIKPIPLQNAEVPAGTVCDVAGWGFTNANPQISPDNLQHAVLKVLSSEECSRHWPDNFANICAQSDNGVNICQGDSGGPLVCDGKLTGASSFVAGMCRTDYPSSFSKVIDPAIREFIRRNAGI